jgi:hypothetical protein
MGKLGKWLVWKLGSRRLYASEGRNYIWVSGVLPLWAVILLQANLYTVIQSSDFREREERSEWPSSTFSGLSGRATWVTAQPALHTVEDNGLSKENPSVLCGTEETSSVWIHTTEIRHTGIECNDLLLLSQTDFLCGLVSFKIAGIKYTNKSNSEKEECDSKFKMQAIIVAYPKQRERASLKQLVTTQSHSGSRECQKTSLNLEKGSWGTWEGCLRAAKQMTRSQIMDPRWRLMSCSRQLSRLISVLCTLEIALGIAHLLQIKSPVFYFT